MRGACLAPAHIALVRANARMRRVPPGWGDALEAPHTPWARRSRRRAVPLASFYGSGGFEYRASMSLITYCGA
jgi:hypothetical protein